MTTARLHATSTKDDLQAGGRTQRPVAPPHVAALGSLEHLQRAAGNRAVAQLVAQREPNPPASSGAPDGDVVQRHTGAASDILQGMGGRQFQSALAQLQSAQVTYVTAHTTAAAEPAGEEPEGVIPATGGV